MATLGEPTNEPHQDSAPSAVAHEERTHAPLTPFSEELRGWRPAWPLRLWLIPVVMIVVTAVVAEQTSDLAKADLHRVITAAGWLMICFTALLVGGLTFAFSESRFPRRWVYAAIGVAIGFGLTWGIAAATLGLASLNSGGE